MKKNLLALLQILIGATLMTMIMLRLHRSGELTKLLDALRTAGSNWPLLLLGFLFFGLCLMICAVRWQLLLRAVGSNLPFRRVLTVHFIGHFFNAFFFGATGGDVIKAYYAATETKAKRTEVAATVFIDRVVGLLALIALVVVIMLARLRFFLTYRETRVALLFNGLLLIGAVIGLFIVFYQNIFERFSIFKKLEERTSLGSIISRTYTAFHVCFRHPTVLVQTVLLSAVNHVSFVVTGYLIGLTLNLELGFFDYLTVLPIINAFAALPLTPSGIGTRETAAIFMLGVMGVAEASAVTLSLLLYATVIVWSLLSGIIYAVFAYKRGRVPKEALSEE